MPGRSGTETKEQGKQMSHYRLHFDGDNPQLTVRKKPDLGFLIKNYQERHIGLNTDALTALMVLRQRKHPESDFVLHRTDGSPWKKRAVQDQFSDLVKSAGLHSSDPREHVAIHSLRHTFGSQLAIRGLPLGKIQALMGHHSVTTTDLFAFGQGRDPD